MSIYPAFNFRFFKTPYRSYFSGRNLAFLSPIINSPFRNAQIFCNFFDCKDIIFHKKLLIFQ